jgi:isoleucyl-tRNA synthetase
MADDLRAQFTEEVNVLSVVPLSEEAGDLVEVTVKPNFRALGKRFGKRTPSLAAALAAVAPADVAAAVRDAGSVTIQTAEGAETLSPDEVIITERPVAGWSVASTDGATVALDLELNDDLIRLGNAREVVRALQEARKSAGYEVTDRIEVRYQASSDAATEVLREHSSTIAEEVLAVTFAAGEVGEDAVLLEELGMAFDLKKADR